MLFLLCNAQGSAAELGAMDGFSGLALACNLERQVHSFDIRTATTLLVFRALLRAICFNLMWTMNYRHSSVLCVMWGECRDVLALLFILLIWGVRTLASFLISFDSLEAIFGNIHSCLNVNCLYKYYAQLAVLVCETALSWFLRSSFLCF